MKKFVDKYNIYNLIWIFIICSFVGSIIEIIWCYFTMGKLMSRSSLLYGQFSVVWGFGGLLLTLLLQNKKEKKVSWIFVIGSLVGGIYEYLCSFLTEKVFGVRFWDYSHLPFQINGRINLLFCCFWGIAAVIWIKIIYPFLLEFIDNIPMHFGKSLTWLMSVFLVFDMVLSAMALIRSYERSQNIPPNSIIEQFLDKHYSDDYLQMRYQNMIRK